MSGGLDGPEPHKRPQPDGRRTQEGIRVKVAQDDDSDRRQAVLSALVKNEPGVLAEVTGLFSRRQVNIKRLVGEPTGDGVHSRITFVVEPPHPGIEQVTKQLEKLVPVVAVEEHDLVTARHLTASIDES